MTSTVRRNEDRSRYELFVDGELAGFADYQASGDALVFPHTEIDPPRRGRGLGALLVQGALDDVRQRNLRVVPTCWFVAQYIAAHPQYRALVAA